MDRSATFAVEVRGKDEYRPAAERDMAATRADYFEAGTLAVWDVDLVAKKISRYHGRSVVTPPVFYEGDIAHAGAAVPEWSIGVDAVFAADSRTR